MTRLTSHTVTGLHGMAKVPGDKSISHRALILGAIAEGVTEIEGLLLGEDVIHTAGALTKMGADITLPKDPTAKAVIRGVGLHGLTPPEDDLEMGNSGTSTRLLMGLVAGQPITARFTGDASLSKRPMKRVTEPLTEMGAGFESADGSDRLPMVVQGSATLTALDYTLPVASAQVKSAILLAALTAKGETRIIEPVPTRDHSENMLKSFGAAVTVTPMADGATEIRLTGGHSLQGSAVTVPGDPSSAAFLTVAALVTPDSEIRMPAIGMNPRRDGLYRSLIEMGADISFDNERLMAGERVVDMTVRSSRLRGVTVPPARAASMIDEYPVLFIAAACAEGQSRMEGLHELTVKESNRLEVMGDGLTACGVSCTVGSDYMEIEGASGHIHGGAEVQTKLDHRIAMSFLVLGMVTKNRITIDDATPIKTSFPDFISLMALLGAQFE
jgi:3-phosphoshikimate 1-carboxyvinyltransferase